jgi:hypothetical protein
VMGCESCARGPWMAGCRCGASLRDDPGHGVCLVKRGWLEQLAVVVG